MLRTLKRGSPPLFLPLHLTVLFYFLLQISPIDTYLAIWRTDCFNKYGAVQKTNHAKDNWEKSSDFHCKDEFAPFCVTQWQLNSLLCWRKSLYFLYVGFWWDACLQELWRASQELLLVLHQSCWCLEHSFAFEPSRSMLTTLSRAFKHEQ